MGMFVKGGLDGTRLFTKQNKSYHWLKQGLHLMSLCSPRNTFQTFLHSVPNFSGTVEALWTQVTRRNKRFSRASAVWSTITRLLSCHRRVDKHVKGAEAAKTYYIVFLLDISCIIVVPVPVLTRVFNLTRVVASLLIHSYISSCWVGFSTFWYMYGILWDAAVDWIQNERF